MLGLSIGLCVIAVIAIIASAVWWGTYDSYYGDKGLWLRIGLCAFSAIVLMIALPWAYRENVKYERKLCARWSVATGYESKYSHLGFMAYECYGKVNDKWIAYDMIRGVED